MLSMKHCMMSTETRTIDRRDTSNRKKMKPYQIQYT